MSAELFCLVHLLRYFHALQQESADEVDSLACDSGKIVSTCSISELLAVPSRTDESCMCFLSCKALEFSTATHGGLSVLSRTSGELRWCCCTHAGHVPHLKGACTP